MRWQRRVRCWRKAHRLTGLSPLITTRPSGTSTRSTSRSVACGSRLCSSVWGSKMRSRLLSAKGSATESVSRASRRRGSGPGTALVDGGVVARAPGSMAMPSSPSASHWCGMRLARKPSSMGMPICSPW